MRDPKSVQRYFVDPVLASPSGHELISEILVAYFQSQICTAWSVATGSLYEAVPVHTAGSEAGTPTYVLFFFFLFLCLSDERFCRLKMIDHYVGRGSQFVECQLLGEEGQCVPMFKIIGIFAT